MIRHANLNDIDAICKIEQECFLGLTAYSKRQLSYLIFKANSSTLVETENDTLRGFAIVLYRKGSHVGCLETIDVDPNFRNQGVGERLLAAAEADMKDHGMRFSQLEVSEGNDAAVKLYKKAGYTLKRKLAGFYKYEHNGTCDADRMVKALT